MKRRDAIFKVAGLMGASFSAPLLMGLSNYEKTNPDETATRFIPENQKKMIEEIADLIIPATKTPGAKAAKVPDFIIMMIEECYPEKDKARFYSGLDEINNKARKTYNKDFLTLSSVEQTNLLYTEEKAARSLGHENIKKEVPFIIMIKELTVFGYFTSEQGCKEALSYVPIPGKYEPCITIKKGEKAWAIG